MILRIHGDFMDMQDFQPQDELVTDLGCGHPGLYKAPLQGQL
jgi:hypothetical protein